MRYTVRCDTLRVLTENDIKGFNIHSCNAKIHVGDTNMLVSKNAKFCVTPTDPMQKFTLAIPTCWYLKTLKLALPPMRNIKFAFPSTQNPNASKWNIGCVAKIALAMYISYCLC